MLRKGLLLISLFGLAGCPEPEPRPLEIFAASSLAELLGELLPAFETQNPGIKLRLSIAGSQVLALQLMQGAQADLFLSASSKYGAPLISAGLIDEQQIFARNRVVLLQRSDAEPQRSWSDLPQVKNLIVGHPESPIGDYTEDFLKQADAHFGAGYAQRLRQKIVSKEANVGLLRSKVLLGSAAAAIVYRSDAHKRPQLQATRLPAVLDRSTTLVAALLNSSRDEGGAFLRFLRSETAEKIILAQAFELP
jgi:molybdate transport system substrate-binding protein